MAAQQVSLTLIKTRKVKLTVPGTQLRRYLFQEQGLVAKSDIAKALQA